MSSIFTAIIEGSLPGTFVWADELCVGFATIEPHTDGHVLVVPREEIDSFVDASEELSAHLMVVAHRIGATQARVFDAPRAGVAIVGFGVDHLHVHVLPIRSEEDMNTTQAGAAGGQERIAQAMERLREGLIADGWGANVPANAHSLTA